MTAEEEADRVLPAIDALRRRFDLPLRPMLIGAASGLVTGLLVVVLGYFLLRW